ncbi:MAG: preprotein translocase subunit YajC [Candidatus Omnitrophica bacterium]|nr:preprotein translocase subunit YajC [Candidatus Omnitrophota bacterium]
MPLEQAGGSMFQILPFLAVFAIFYFLVIKPEKNKQKARKEKITSIKKNDQVVTAGGLHGTIVNIKETTVVLRVDDNVKIEFDKEAISTVK